MISLLLGCAMLGAEPAGVVLQVPNETSTNKVHFSISIGGRPAERAWSEFLDHWIELFDADHDGKLSLREAEIIPTLANSAGSPIRLDFPVADTNMDGDVSCLELQRFYEHHGIRGINVVSATEDQTAVQTGEILWKLLDRNNDGQLSSEELNSALLLLNRFDHNEDECLSVQELSTQTATKAATSFPVLKWSFEQELTADTARIPLGLALLDQDVSEARKPEDHLPAGLEMLDGNRIRFRLRSTRVVVELAEASVQKIVAGRQYLLGEINTAMAGASALDIDQIRSDPALDWLVPLMPVLDADQSQNLSDSEIKSYIALLAEGAAAQLSIAATIRGRNLFDLIDTNDDGQLELRELANAKNVFINVERADKLPEQLNILSLQDVPWSLNIGIRRGPITGRFGRLRIAKRQTEVRSPSPSKVIPRWFAAMDRNRDQILSPSEFIGTLMRFRELDRNSDGVITSEEAQPQPIDHTDSTKN